MGSNIHSLSDLPSGAQEGSFWGPRRNRSTEYLVGDGTEPRCIDMFLPGFTWNSFVLYVSFVQIAVYIVTVFVESSGLEPSGDVLSLFGSSYGPPIQKGQVFRLLTPIFLHSSIWHILFNVYFQLRMAFPLERTYGIWPIGIVYFAAGLAGNLFSVAVAPCHYSVGASTAGFGLIGVQMAEIALAWHLIQRSQRDQAIFNIVVFVVISVMLAASPSSKIDWRGHLGGFIAGFSCGVLLNRQMENQPRWLKSIGVTSAVIALAALYIACTTVIFAIPMSGPNGRCA